MSAKEPQIKNYNKLNKLDSIENPFKYSKQSWLMTHSLVTCVNNEFEEEKNKSSSWLKLKCRPYVNVGATFL